MSHMLINYKENINNFKYQGIIFVIEKMSLDIHKELIQHYRKSSLYKQKKGIKGQSVVKHTFVKKNIENQKGGTYQQFLKNQEHISAQSDPLNFRQLPRALKVYFPGPPQAPPKLQQTPYTYQIVPKVPFRIPKQKKGHTASWVLQESYFLEPNTKPSKQLNKSQRTHNRKNSDLGIRFRNAVKKLVVKMKEQNLSLEQIIKNKGTIKKAYNFYNSQEFFAMIKNGDLEAQRLLQINPYLAFDVDQLKMTPLHWAARVGHAEIVNILTRKYRANPLAKDQYGRTPLHLAVAKKNIECVIRIFIQGGKLTSLNNAKESVRMVAPDSYTKYLLQKLEQVRFIVRAKGIKDMQIYHKQLQQGIRNVLDGSSLYF